MVRFALATACVVALASQVLANGRPPQTSTISFRPGAENEITVGTSFGLLISKDGGASFRWMCEDALPYGGMYDPDYEVMASGTLFATTFDGLKVNRDGCTFDLTPLAPAPENPPKIKFFSVTARANNNTYYAAAADPVDGTIYKSTDEGQTFEPLGTPGQIGDWWQSLEAAPSDPLRLYLTGFRFVMMPGQGTTKQLLFFTSANGGTTWDAVPLTGLTTMKNSTLEIAGIHPTDPLHVFLRVTLEDNAVADGIYETTTGGAPFTRLLGKPGTVALVVRKNGDVVIGTRAEGTFVRKSGMSAFTELAGAPHPNCLVENAAGEVWACTQNYGAPGVPMDGYGIMKSSDLATWTPVLKYQDIVEPVTCPNDTLQYNKCDKPAGEGGPLGWCGLCEQLGCDPKRPCAAAPDGAPAAKKEGCCDTSGGGAASALAIGGLVGIVLGRRRKRR